MTRRAETPPFDRAHEGILGYIDAHGLTAGDPLPSERDLCQELAVSRTTLRTALARLASVGIVEVRKGSGTFVCPERPAMHLDDVAGFSEMVRRVGATPSSRLISSGIERASRDVCERLYLPEGEPVFSLARVRLADGVETCLESTFLRASSVPGIERMDFAEDSLVKILEQSYGIFIRHTSLKVSVRRLDAREGALLGKPAGSLAFYERGIRLDADMNPVEFCRTLYAPDRFKIVCESRL